eukprot:749241-Rhodomonas_salina.1
MSVQHHLVAPCAVLVHEDHLGVPCAVLVQDHMVVPQHMSVPHSGLYRELPYALQVPKALKLDPTSVPQDHLAAPYSTDSVQRRKKYVGAPYATDR